MTPPPQPKPAPIPPGWLPLVIAGGIYSVIILLIVILRAETGTDFRDFWENAVHFRETGEIAADLGVHNYLPFFTILMLPWSFLPLQVSIAIFTILSLGCLATTVVMVEDLLNDGLGPRPRMATYIALALMLPYITSCAILGNLGLLLVFLIVMAWFFVERGHEWQAGAALGLATLIKLLPAALIIYFLIKRRFRVAGMAIAVFIVLGFTFPLATLGYERTIAQHRAFFDRAARQHSAYVTITGDAPKKANFSNNAVPMVLRRLLTPTDGGKETIPQPLYVNFASFPRNAIFTIYIVLMLVVAGLSIVAALRASTTWPPPSVEVGRNIRAQFGIWCCLMLLASPLVWTHYLPLVYWPIALLADRAARQHRATRRRLTPTTLALTCWLLGAFLLAWPAARAAGAQIASVLILWTALIWITLRTNLHAPQPHKPPSLHHPDESHDSSEH